VAREGGRGSSYADVAEPVDNHAAGSILVERHLSQDHGKGTLARGVRPQVGSENLVFDSNTYHQDSTGIEERPPCAAEETVRQPSPGYRHDNKDGKDRQGHCS